MKNKLPSNHMLKIQSPLISLLVVSTCLLWSNVSSSDDELNSIIESEIEELTTQAVEEDIEEQTESSIEEDIEEQAENSVEEDIEEQAESSIEEDIEEQAESSIEEDIEEQAESSIEEDIEEQTESSVEDDIEEQSENSVEDDIEEQAENSVEEDIEDQTEKDTDDELEDDIEDQLNHDIDEEDEEHAGSDIEGSIDDDLEQQAGSEQTNTEESLPRSHFDFPENLALSQINDDIEERDLPFQLDADSSGNLKVSNQQIIFVPTESIAVFRASGQRITRETKLSGLDGLLVEVSTTGAESGLPIDESVNIQSRKSVDETVETLSKGMDYNHIYKPQASLSHSKSSGQKRVVNRSPHTYLNYAQDQKFHYVSVGLIDSKIDLTHPSLEYRSIISKSFVADGLNEPEGHGTAVASILYGKTESFQGVLAGLPKLYTASVFFDLDESKQNATVSSLVLSLDWMAQQGVKIINMSMTGPNNQVLNSVVDALYDKGIVIVAAVGNQGPASVPLYPAAYPSVVSVSAIDQYEKIYYLASRGDHVDLVAPGVNIYHASMDGGYSTSSGTSYATAFITALLAHEMTASKAPNLNRLLRSIYSRTKDLGPKGFDEIYGHGLSLMLNP